MFLEHVGRTGKPVILSTGMSSQDEIEQAYQTLRENGCKEIALLKCTSHYPTPIADVHLKAMFTLKERFDAVVGFSDHTEGLGASPYAVAMGASIVEKHFTVDKTLPGPDHQASLSPEELTAWVKEIRKVEQMLGSPVLQPTKGEEETRKALRRSLVSKGDLKKGETITRRNIDAKRTGAQGIPAQDFYKVLGLTLNCDLPKDRPVHWSYLGK
jgi:sialic acid synthase SpsE